MHCATAATSHTFSSLPPSSSSSSHSTLLLLLLPLHPPPVPDFRSGMDTVLQTGPGAWELRAKGQLRDTKKHKVTTTSKAIPTITHMSLVKLHEVSPAPLSTSPCLYCPMPSTVHLSPPPPGRATEMCCQSEL